MRGKRDRSTIGASQRAMRKPMTTDGTEAMTSIIGLMLFRNLAEVNWLV